MTGKKPLNFETLFFLGSILEKFPLRGSPQLEAHLRVLSRHRNASHYVPLHEENGQIERAHLPVLSETHFGSFTNVHAYRRRGICQVMYEMSFGGFFQFLGGCD